MHKIWRAWIHSSGSANIFIAYLAKRLKIHIFAISFWESLLKVLEFWLQTNFFHLQMQLQDAVNICNQLKCASWVTYICWLLHKNHLCKLCDNVCFLCTFLYKTYHPVSFCMCLHLQKRNFSSKRLKLFWVKISEIWASLALEFVWYLNKV